MIKKFKLFTINEKNKVFTNIEKGKCSQVIKKDKVFTNDV